MDFSGQNLRGRNFKGQDLTGANFSYADIRGANFTNAKLRGANFTGAKAGLQKRWIIPQFMIAFGVSILSGILLGFSGAFTGALLTFSAIQHYTIVPGLLVLAVLVIALSTLIWQGFTVTAFETIAGIGAVAALVIGVFTAQGTLISAGAAAIIMAIISMVASLGVLAITVVFVSTAMRPIIGATVITTATITAISVASFVLFITVGMIAFAVAGAFSVPKIILVISTVIVSIGATVTSIYIGRQAIANNEKFSLIRVLGVAIGGIGGTTFQGADLTDSSFNKAILKGTNFAGSYRQPTILARVCWAGAQKLEHARVGNSILASTFVRELLVTSNGYKKSFVNADLRGANLNGVNLNKANLKRADLSEATLQQANLAQANLTEVQAIGTNFTGATFTGACLEAWNIDYTTQLDQIDCQYVYLLEHANELGNRERRPHDPNSVFAPGDFTKLYTKIINTVEILLRNGVNREAFAEAFQKLMQENPEISFDSIQSIEKKGDDVLLTLTVPENSDKAKISQDFLKPYEERIRQLEAKVDELQTLRSTDLKDIALALANQSLNITNQAVGEGKAVQGNNDSSRKLNIGSIGGDFNASGQALNFGEMNISGQVTNTINQLPASSQPDEPGIKELLEQLHRAIESAEELKPEDKAEALKQVQALAEAGKDPAEPEKKNGAKSAIRWLKGMLTELAEPSAIVQLCKHVLPQIAGIFGL